MLATVALVLAALAAVVLVRLWYVVRPRRGREPGFKYVCVKDDGSVRELDDDEREYLSSEFGPTDGNRPYVKLTYESRTPDGRLSGYLSRRRVPRRIEILPDGGGTNDPRMRSALAIDREQL